MKREMTEQASSCADGRLNRDKKAMLPDPDAHFSKGRIGEMCKTLLWTCLFCSVTRYFTQEGVALRSVVPHSPFGSFSLLPER